jgi:lipoprotein-anchoring transpeptidase ErfK/SrfK
VVTALAVSVPITVALALALVAEADPSGSAATASHRLASAAPAIAFGVPEPRPLDASLHDAVWAPVRRAAAARAAPRRGGRVIARLDTRTPEGTTGIVAVLGRAHDAGDRVWTRVRLPVLSNATGWVPRGALGGYGLVRTRLVVDMRSLQATLLRDGRPVFRAPVGVGRARWPTPRGQFFVRNRLTRYRSPFYGPVAFGTSARSRVLTDWPAGGYIGIHGTNRPDLIPGRVSHGCIRLRNADIRRLARLMGPGTPITIR